MNKNYGRHSTNSALPHSPDMKGLRNSFRKRESVLRQKTFPLGRSSSPVGSGAQKEQFMFPNGWSRFFAS